MTTLVICGIRDRKLEEYSNPMFFPTIGFAERAFLQEVRRPDDKNQLYTSPDDFSLYALGTLYTETGHIEVFNPPVLVVDGKTIPAC